MNSLGFIYCKTVTLRQELIYGFSGSKPFVKSCNNILVFFQKSSDKEPRHPIIELVSRIKGTDKFLRFYAETGHRNDIRYIQHYKTVFTILSNSKTLYTITTK